MDQIIKIGIIGDFDSSYGSQLKTNEALNHASNMLHIKSDLSWIPTKSLTADALESEITSFSAIWAGPGDYKNPKGVIDAIQYCRENDIPFLGT